MRSVIYQKLLCSAILMSETKLRKLSTGKTVQFSPEELGAVYRLGLSPANMKKIEKAHKAGKGVRLTIADENELYGSGLKSMALQGAKSLAKNKQLRKLADQGLDRGMNYALDQSGIQDEGLKRMIKKTSQRALNQQIDDMAGSGFQSMAMKGAKSLAKNKQIRKIADQGLDRGLNYALDQSGIQDEGLKRMIKKTSQRAINQQIDTVSGSGLTLAEAYAQHKSGQGIGFGKVLKGAKKGLKIGNKISNALGYDDLDNMAIDFATTQTLGRIDPTLGNIASKQLNRLADKEMKRGGSFRKIGGSFGKIGGGVVPERNLRIYDDGSNMIKSDHPANYPGVSNRSYFA
jgi:transcriptional regulator NrdR family protein